MNLRSIVCIVGSATGSWFRWSAMLFGTFFLTAGQILAQTTSTWSLAGNGNWSVGANWSTNPVAPINGQPLAGDLYNAVLNTARTITVDTPVVIQALTQTTGTITGTNGLTLNGLFSWSGGTMSGASTTDALGGMTLSGIGTKTLSGRTLNHGDGVNAVTANWTAGTFSIVNGATFTNKAAALFDTNFDGSMSSGSGTNAFNNEGTFTKSGGTGATTVSQFMSFNNSGTVNVNSGLLNLNSGGTHSGAFNVVSGSELNFGIGATVAASNAFNAGASISGAGTTGIYNSTVTANAAVTISTPLNLSGGAIDGAGAITASGPVVWDSTDLRGTSAATDFTNMTGGVTMSGIATKPIDKRTLNLGDGVNSSMANWTAGTLQILNGAIVNKAAATFDTNFDGFVTANAISTGAFTNEGVFTKSGGAGTTEFNLNVSFSNSGTVNVNSGTLMLEGGGTQSGAFNVAAGSALRFGGTHSVGASTTFSDTATSTMEVFTGTTTVTPALSLLGTFKVSGGTATLNNTATLNVLEVSGGTLNGSGVITASGASTWSFGTIGGTSTADTIHILGGMTLSGTGTKTLSARTLNNGDGVNASTMNWTNGGIDIRNSAIFNNKAGATIDTNFDGTITGSVLGVNNTFNNEGTFTKSGGTGTTQGSLLLVFNNSGIVNVNSGTMDFDGTGTHTGTFNVAAGSTLSFSGTNVLNAGAGFAGTGTTALLGGTTTANAAVTIGTTLSISAGTLNGAGAITVSGPLVWGGSTSAIISGTSAATDIINVTGGMTLGGGIGSKDLSNRTMNHGDGVNASTATWTVGEFRISNGGIFNNKAAATFDTNFDGLVQATSGAGTFNNQGTFTKSGGAGTTTVNLEITFNNTGTVNVNSGTLSLTVIPQHSGTTLTGGTWNVTNGSALTFTGGSNITTNASGASVTLDGAGSSFSKFTTALNSNQGSFTLKNDRDLTTAGAFANSGTVRVEDSTTVMTIGAGGGSAYTQTGGVTILAGGAMIDASAFNLDGGALSGTGTIDAPLTTSGSTIIGPGASAGAITVNGNATFGGGNMFAAEIGGLLQGAQYDYLDVNGVLTLAGLLDVDFINGFQNSLQLNDAFTIATANSPILGAFSNAASGSLVSTNFAQSLYVFYGAGSPFDANSVILTQMPEPGRAMLLMLALFGMVMRRRRT